MIYNLPSNSAYFFCITSFGINNFLSLTSISIIGDDHEDDNNDDDDKHDEKRTNRKINVLRDHQTRKKIREKGKEVIFTFSF